MGSEVSKSESLNSLINQNNVLVGNNEGSVTGLNGDQRQNHEKQCEQRIKCDKCERYYYAQDQSCKF
ncbi:hypothetical protein BGX27_004485, partial [Mortierella sp. AM989]